MTRAAKIFWCAYLAWVALIGASTAGLLPWRWYAVLAVPFVVAVGGFLIWLVVTSLLTAHFRVRAYFAHQRRRP